MFVTHNSDMQNEWDFLADLGLGLYFVVPTLLHVQSAFATFAFEIYHCSLGVLCKRRRSARLQVL